MSRFQRNFVLAIGWAIAIGAPNWIATTPLGNMLSVAIIAYTFYLASSAPK